MNPKEKFTRIPVEQVTVLPKHGGFYDLILDHWWGITSDNEILLYRGYSRQCNVSKEITERVIRCEGHPATSVVFLPIVYLKHECKDYL